MKNKLKTAGIYLALFVAYLISMIISGLVFNTTKGLPLPADNAFAGKALLLVSLIHSVVLTTGLLLMQKKGWKSILLAILSAWGFQTFMTQIETLIFLKAFPAITPAMIPAFFLSGLLTTALFMPLAGLLTGHFSGRDRGTAGGLDTRRLALKLALLMPVYAILYFVFGQIPYAFEEVRAFYATWQTGFDFPGLFAIQMGRGLLWALISLPLLSLFRLKKLPAALVFISWLAVLPVAQLLFPNPFMPPFVRLTHFIEIFSCHVVLGTITMMLLYQGPATQRATA